VLTVDFNRLGVLTGATTLDIGCGGGRHSFELLRRGAHVYALDHNGDDLVSVDQMFTAMRQFGEIPPGSRAAVVQSDARHLPFPTASLDTVIISEVLEHIHQDEVVIAEIARILRPGGRLAVTVPRFWPERVCWALSRAYHEVEGGHIRIYRRRQLRQRLTSAGFTLTGRHHAHALHSPYWWLKCLVGTDNDRALLPRLYHRFLVYDLMRRPWWSRLLDRALNPVLGKSVVLYLRRNEAM
jgi:SAM-dependent methyltransferase